METETAYSRKGGRCLEQVKSLGRLGSFPHLVSTARRRASERGSSPKSSEHNRKENSKTTLVHLFSSKGLATSACPKQDSICSLIHSP